jgi:hypothetical protein
MIIGRLVRTAGCNYIRGFFVMLVSGPEDLLKEALSAGWRTTLIVFLSMLMMFVMSSSTYDSGITGGMVMLMASGVLVFGVLILVFLVVFMFR